MGSDGTTGEPSARDTPGPQALIHAARDEHSGLTDSTRLAIPLGLALITGAFVALGIQGDLLSRLMRNSPNMVITAFGLGVVGVVVPLFALLLKKGRARSAAFAAGGLLLLIGTVSAILAAVSGTGIRGSQR
jgi:cytochrome bd-type quinol oxidase subunit 2